MLKGDVAVVMLAAFRGMCFLFLVRLRRGMVRATSFLKNINCFRQAIARTRGIILLFFARVLTFRALVGWAPSGSRTVPGRPGAPGIGPSKSSSKPTHEDPEMTDLFGLSGRPDLTKDLRTNRSRSKEYSAVGPRPARFRLPTAQHSP